MHDTLRDIKPLIAFNDNSLALFVIAILLGILLMVYFFIKSYRHAQTKCKTDCEKYYFYQFSNIDWSKPKEAAYLATKYGLILAKDRRRRELFIQLRESLDSYKYKKDAHEVDEKTLNYYNLYKQVCDESL